MATERVRVLAKRELDAYRTGFLAACDELASLIDHWQACGLRAGVLDGLHRIEEGVRVGWDCDDTTHDAPGCLAHRPGHQDAQPAVLDRLGGGGT